MRFLQMLRFAPFLALLLGGCALGGKINLSSLEEEGVLPKGSRQVLLVNAPEPSSVLAIVTALEKTGGKWVEAIPPIRGVAGRAGFAPPGEKREGDGRTPSGIFPLRRAFGYGAQSPTRLSYRQATEDDLWVDDQNSPDYNRWVKRGETSAASFEEMRRKDDLYRYGIVIEYNTQPVVGGDGSAIFFHIWKGEGEPTAGCIAMDEEDLLKVLNWLDPEKEPVTVMGTEENLKGAVSSPQKQL